MIVDQYLEFNREIIVVCLIVCFYSNSEISAILYNFYSIN